MRQLPELINENGSSRQLLVVICLAAYAKEQSNYAWSPSFYEMHLMIKHRRYRTMQNT